MTSVEFSNCSRSISTQANNRAATNPASRPQPSIWRLANTGCCPAASAMACGRTSARKPCSANSFMISRLSQAEAAKVIAKYNTKPVSETIPRASSSDSTDPAALGIRYMPARVSNAETAVVSSVLPAIQVSSQVPMAIRCPCAAAWLSARAWVGERPLNMSNGRQNTQLMNSRSRLAQHATATSPPSAIARRHSDGFSAR